MRLHFSFLWYKYLKFSTSFIATVIFFYMYFSVIRNTSIKQPKKPHNTRDRTNDSCIEWAFTMLFYFTYHLTKHIIFSHHTWKLAIFLAWCNMMYFVKHSLQFHKIYYIFITYWAINEIKWFKQNVYDWCYLNVF